MNPCTCSKSAGSSRVKTYALSRRRSKNGQWSIRLTSVGNREVVLAGETRKNEAGVLETIGNIADGQIVIAPGTLRRMQAVAKKA